MTWINRIVNVVKSASSRFGPLLGSLYAARDFVSESTAQRIKDAACAKAYELLAKTHRNVVSTIIWQNAALLLSLLPVYFLHSAIPFYIAYASVAGYSIYSVAQSWPLVVRLFNTRSIHQAISLEVFDAIELDLTQRPFYERKAVKWLVPDLKKIADDVALKIRPDIVAAVFNMVLTLLLAFVAFRLFAIPMLEHKALLGYHHPL
jgi:hypothetical protein